MANSVLRIPIPGEQADEPRSYSVGFDLPWFICGPENRLVELALNGLLAYATVARDANRKEAPNFEPRAPRTIRPPVVPLYLFGPTGCGKTHIAHGLADSWGERFGAEEVRYTTAIDFARSFMTTDDLADHHALRELYGCLSLFVLDDVDHLLKRPLPQRELLTAIDVIMGCGHLMVVTASTAPGRISGLLPALQSRLSEGLVVPLAPPAMETRRELAQRMASRRGLSLNDQELAAVAGSVDVSPRSIARRLQQLELVRHVGWIDPKNGLNAHPHDMDVPCRAVSCQTVPYQIVETPMMPTLKSITAVTAHCFGISQTDLRSSSRRQSIVHARGIAIYLGRELTNQSLAKIGREYGGRDHTTVLYACRTTAERISHNTTTRETVAKLRRILVCG